MYLLTVLYSILRPVLPRDAGNSSSYYFLRRLVTTSHLPPRLRENFQLQDSPATIHLLLPPPLPLVLEDIVAALHCHVEFEPLPIVRSTHIPLHPPTSAEQAALWSKTYWPCIFNPASQTIQKAPPLNLVRAILAELNKAERLDLCFQLAEFAAAECVAEGLGREIGAVIFDPAKEIVVAVAGDARWYEQPDGLTVEGCQRMGLADGRPEHHALMRATAMVAEKQERQRNGSESLSSNAPEGHGKSLGGRPTTLTERLYAAPLANCIASLKKGPEMPRAQSVQRQDSYLCHGLDVYLTHEPCIACSMAMIHSRFRACIFLKRMPGTGGLCAENDDGGLGYGLFWRKELNWRVLTFQYMRPDGGYVGLKTDVCYSHGGPDEMIFHA